MGSGTSPTGSVIAIWSRGYTANHRAVRLLGQEELRWWSVVVRGSQVPLSQQHRRAPPNGATATRSLKACRARELVIGRVVARILHITAAGGETFMHMRTGTPYQTLIRRGYGRPPLVGTLGRVWNLLTETTRATASSLRVVVPKEVRRSMSLLLDQALADRAHC